MERKIRGYWLFCSAPGGIVSPHARDGYDWVSYETAEEMQSDIHYLMEVINLIVEESDDKKRKDMLSELLGSDR